MKGQPKKHREIKEVKEHEWWEHNRNTITGFGILKHKKRIFKTPDFGG